MEIVKKNLFLIIIGLVMLLVLVASWWPLGSWAAQLQTDMDTRLHQVGIAEQLGRSPVSIAGISLGAGPITQEMIDKKKQVGELMKNQQTSISSLASDLNQGGRCKMVDGKLVPLIVGQVADTDLYNFKVQYESVFNVWLTQLASPDRTIDVTQPLPVFDINNVGIPGPPDMTVITTAWNKEQADIIARQNNGLPGAPVVAAAAVDPEYTRNYVRNRANSIAMYVLPGAFEKLAFAGGTAPPKEVDRDTALVQCWLQQDIVTALAAANPFRTVAQNPVKRLDKINLGSPLFVAGKTAGLDYTQSFTGRVGNDKYDVASVQIQIVATPEGVNQFIRQLYLKSNSYTVLSIRITTDDPIAAASNGYLYGNSSIVSATIRVEAILFKQWTNEVLPKDFLHKLGGSGSGFQNAPTPDQGQGGGNDG